MVKIIRRLELESQLSRFYVAYFKRARLKCVCLVVCTVESNLIKLRESTEPFGNAFVVSKDSNTIFGTRLFVYVSRKRIAHLYRLVIE